VIQESIFGAQQDLVYMHKALAQAQQAADQEEVPVGAVLVDQQGNIIAQAYNKTESRHSQTAHAELQLIQEGGHHMQDWRLTGCWLYVTLEPCIMCMGCIYLSRLAGLVYGARSPLFGMHLDNTSVLPVYRIDALCIVPGVAAHEAETMLKSFFRTRRRRTDDH
jgi:tRNA(adenine34) deaminase